MALTITAGPTAEWHITSVSSLAVLLVTGSVNDVIEVVIAASNSGTSGVSAITGVTDSAGNDYDPVTTVNRTQGSAADDGTTLGIYSSRLTSALTAGTITVSFSPAVPQASIVTVRIQPSAGHFPELVAVGAGASGDASTMSITSSSITSGHTIIGAVAIETDDTFTPDSDTSNGAWSTHTSAIADNGGDNLCQYVSCQWKTVTGAATQTYNVATGGGTRDYAINWFSVRETELILNGCEGQWKLDESSGSGVDSRGSNTLAQTGTVGAATGKIDGARDFSSSNYLSIASNASLSTGDISFSLACWAKFDSFGALRPLMCKWSAFGQNEYELAYSVGLGKMFFGVSSGGSDENYIAADTYGTPSTGTWMFVIAWHDADADTINIQIDDGTVDSTSYSSGVVAGTSAFQIGAKDTGGGSPKYMDGLIDQARLWKRVLTADERTQLYEEGASSGRSADQAVSLDGVASGTASTTAIAATQSAYVGTVAGSTAAATAITSAQAVSVFSITYSAAATVAVAQDQSASIDGLALSATASVGIASDQADSVEVISHESAGTVSIGAAQSAGVDGTTLAATADNSISGEQAVSVGSISSDAASTAAIGVDQASDVEGVQADTAMTGIVQAVREADQAVNLDSITFAGAMGVGVGAVSQTTVESFQWAGTSTNAISVDADNAVSITGDAGATASITATKAASVDRLTAASAWAAVIAAIHDSRLSVGYSSSIIQTPLVSMCVQRYGVYVPGSRVSSIYQPGSAATQTYQPGSSDTSIYQPGAIDDVYQPGSSATQVGCHE